jgi:hypothetical protein
MCFGSCNGNNTLHVYNAHCHVVDRVVLSCTDRTKIIYVHPKKENKSHRHNRITGLPQSPLTTPRIPLISQPNKTINNPLVRSGGIVVVSCAGRLYSCLVLTHGVLSMRRT